MNIEVIMTEIKPTYKLYQLSERIQEIEDCIESIEGVDIPAELHEDYLAMLEELEQTKEDFEDKIDNILSLIQSRKSWLEIRKSEVKRLQELVKRDETTIDWLTKYLKEHLERRDIKKLRTKRFNLSIRKASIEPLILRYEEAENYPKKYQKVTIEIDKKQLKEDIKNGDETALKYAKLGEKSTYISIK